MLRRRLALGVSALLGLLAVVGTAQDDSRQIVRKSGGTPAYGGTWDTLEALAAKASYPVTVSTTQSLYRPGEKLVVSVQVTEPGYVNVINVGAGDADATVLFPNKHHLKNEVAAGQKITIPAPGDTFELPAELPSGKDEQQTLVVVVHTKHPLNAYDSGSGNEFVRSLSGGATRAFSVAAASPAAAAAGGARYGAGKVVVLIRK